MMRNTSNFGKRLRRLRKEAGLSVDEIAYLAETSTNNIYNWELGKFEPRLSTALKLANALDVSLDYLAGYGDDEEEDNEEI